MIPYRCFVQAGQAAAEAEAALRADLEAFSQRAFAASAHILWITVPQGSGFSAGSLSTASIIMAEAPSPLGQPRRAALLQELSELWIARTGCSYDDLVAVISDPRAA